MEWTQPRAGAARLVVATALTVALALLVVPPSLAASLYRGREPRPGPDLLYAPRAIAPQLTNTGPWKARPILVSGATAYRHGEFLYQDFLYDDDGAAELPDPGDPRAANQADLFSKPDGTYTYPTGPGYANNAADLVELRVKPLRRKTAFRVTLNTLENPSLIAFSIAIGGHPGRSFQFPYGANVSAPARLFLTVHPASARRTLVATLTSASTGRRVSGPPVRVHVDRLRRQITVFVPHRDWNPRRKTVRLAMGVGLWNASAGRYLLPQAAADATHPGGAGTAARPAAFFNVAFRTNGQEPTPVPTAGLGVLTDARWWRDEAQGHALAGGDISAFFANVNFGKLGRKVTDNSRVPRTGPLDRIVSSRFQAGQGVDYSGSCGLNGATKPASCQPEYLGRLQPYAIYIPPARRPARGYGLTVLLHSLSANYNQYLGIRNQRQFGDRPIPSIVITPEARGPDLYYEGYGAADVFEVWADVARHYALDPSHTDLAGYSMGGIGTFKLGAQFPDLFARAQPTVGYESVNDVLASLRNVPVLMWNESADELVNASDYTPTAMRLANLGYRYELDVFQPCASALCSALFPDHLMLAVNDQFAPPAAFLGTAPVDRDPAHVTYVYYTPRDRPRMGIVANHAYWVSRLTLRNGASGEGQIDALSHGFGVGDPPASGVHTGTGTLTGGNLGPLQFASFSQSWGAAPGAARADAIDLSATNIQSAAIDVRRAGVNCHVVLRAVKLDGPLTVRLPGCRRTVHLG